MLKKQVITSDEKKAFAKGPTEKVMGNIKDFEANRRQESSLFCDVVAIHTAQTKGFPDLMYQFFRVAPTDLGKAKHAPATPAEEHDVQCAQCA